MMKRKNKIGCTSLLCAAAVAVSLCGCAGRYENESFELYDGAGAKLGEFEGVSVISLLDDKLVYSGYSSDIFKFGRFDYGSYDLNTGESGYIGTISGFDSVYQECDVCRSDNMYLLITHGERGDDVYNFDLGAKTLEKLSIDGAEELYPNMALSDGSLILINRANGEDSVLSYNTASEETTTLTSEKAEGAVPIRAVCRDNDRFYDVRAVYGESNEKTLYLDIRDLSFGLLGSIDLTEMLETKADEFPNSNEEYVSDFAVRNGYMYYHNHDGALFVCRIVDDKSVEVLHCDRSFPEPVYSGYEHDDAFMFVHLGWGEDNTKLYRFDTSDGRLRVCDLGMDDADCPTRSVTIDSGSHILLRKSAKVSDKSEGVPNKLVYLGTDELEFKDVKDID